MSAKLVELKTETHNTPLQCVEGIVDDLKSGKLKVRRLMVVAQLEESDEFLHIRGGGTRTDDLITAIGLLQMAVTDLGIAGLPVMDVE